MFRPVVENVLHSYSGTFGEDAGTMCTSQRLQNTAAFPFSRVRKQADGHVGSGVPSCEFNRRGFLKTG